MPMNGRLLRPRQTIHPEAADWANRVRTNGGSVSGTTLTAVDRFVKAIHAAGIRDRFYRLNLFCGNSDATLAAVRTPLFRGPSLTGTQYGNATDTNVNFVAGDYAETGASGGLKGDGSSKHLLTGFLHNVLPQNDSHLSCYEVTRGTITFRPNIGARSGNTTGYLAMGGWSNLANYTFLSFESASTLTLASSIGGHYVGNVTGAAASALYRNGGGKVTSTSTTRTPGANEIAVMAMNNQNLGFDRTDARLAGYSFGLSFASDAHVLAFSNAMQALQASLGRSVA